MELIKATDWVERRIYNSPMCADGEVRLYCVVIGENNQMIAAARVIQPTFHMINGLPGIKFGTLEMETVRAGVIDRWCVLARDERDNAALWTPLAPLAEKAAVGEGEWITVNNPSITLNV